MRTRSAVVVLILAILAWEHRSAASVEPRWTLAQLTDFSAAVIRGRVGRTYAAFDAGNGLIYTYVEIHVRSLLKGALPRVVVIKQMGGQVGDLLLAVIDAPRFATGEEVVLFLEVRPRDGSFYTTAHSQGKWIVDSAGTESETLRRGDDVHSMTAVREVIASRSADASRLLAGNPNPDDARATFELEAPAFTLMPEPWGAFRFHSADAGATIPVDTEPLGQYGLVGRGRAETQRAAQIWSGAGARITLGLGLEQSRVCANVPFPSGRIHVSYRDPCNEIDDNGGIVALAAAWVDATNMRTVNGLDFKNARGGFIINNNSSTAQRYLRRSRCFQDIQTHELGHAIGLGHSPLTASLMHADTENLDSCKPPQPIAVSWTVPTEFFRLRLGSCAYRGVTAAVQVTGILSDQSFDGELRFPTLAITPEAGWPTSCNLRVSIPATIVPVTARRVITGYAGYGYAETSTGRNPFGITTGERHWGIDFHFCDPTDTPWCTPTFVWDSRVQIGLYYSFDESAYTESFGSRGDFVGASGIPPTEAPLFAGNGLGSDDIAGARFIYPGGGLTAPSQLTATVSDGAVTLRWTAPSPSPASYVVEVGTQSGASNLVTADVGARTQVSGALVPGTYYARVRAVYSSGVSTPSAEVMFVVGAPATLSPPTGLAAQVTDTNVALTWNAVSGATGYVVEAGTGAGLTNLANIDVGNVQSVSASVGLGRYYVRVRARNASVRSDPSNEITFVVVCESAPSPPATVSGRVVGTTATVEWSSSPGATSYTLQVESPNGEPILFRDVGNRTSISAGVPLGFRAFVSVFAENRCGVSAATPALLVQ
jgi:hypothetical protein